MRRDNQAGPGTGGGAVDDVLPRGQERSFVGWPRRPGDERRTGRHERLEERPRQIHRPGAGPHLVIPRVAGDRDAIGTHAEGHQPGRVAFVNRADGVKARICVAKKRAGQPAPRRAFGERGTDQAERDTARAGLGREDRPDVELAEDERGGPQCIEQRARIDRRVKGQDVGQVNGERARERLSAR